MIRHVRGGHFRAHWFGRRIVLDTHDLRFGAFVSPKDDGSRHVWLHLPSLVFDVSLPGKR